MDLVLSETIRSPPRGRQSCERSLRGSSRFDDFPRLVRHHEQHRTEGPHREVSAFELGLDVMRDGLKEMLKTERFTGRNRSRT
jgi:hypothetical protein